MLFDIYGTLFISASGDIGLARQNSPQLAEIRALLEKYRVQLSPRDLLDQFHAAIQDRHAELHARGIEFPAWNEADDAHDKRPYRPDMARPRPE